MAVEPGCPWDETVPTVDSPAGRVEDAPAAMEVLGFRKAVWMKGLDGGYPAPLMLFTKHGQLFDGQLSVTGTERQV